MAWSETIPYRHYREPYLPNFFPAAAKTLGLTRASRLLDLACGTGTVAFGFAMHAGPLTGVDPEQPMLDLARATAAHRKIDIQLICAAIEDIPGNIGTFDVATIGKAHWYLPRAQTLSQLGKLLAPGGRVLICSTSTHDGLSGPWASAFRRTRNAWRRIARSRISERQFMAGSPFAYVQSIQSRAQCLVPVEYILQRALAFAGTSPAALGAEKERYLADVRAAVEPHAVNGMLRETFVTTGAIFARRP